ncbi:NAD-P-binding protein [Mycena capillaripes]|nr:NAD-P-binding protein [Mycena capillaripes]
MAVAQRVYFFPSLITPQIILVTGGNSGTGYETVKALLLKNATVYLAARSPSKAKEAIAQLESETQKRAEFLELDLADLESLPRAADAFLALESRLDILFNNGGLTAQGYDLQFGTNTIGHYFLTELLLPALIASHEHDSVPARIIHTSSAAHTLAPARSSFFSAVKGSLARKTAIKKWGGMRALCKLGNIIVSGHYAKKYSDILVSCALTFSPTPVGAYPPLWAGTTASPEDINGKYFVPVGVAKPPGRRSGDTQLAHEVMVYLKEAVEGF